MRTDFASVARLLANPARSTMLGALMDGRAMTGGELARLAGVAPSTASEHLDELVTGGLVSVTAEGRHRYFRIADAAIAEALEAFSRICPETQVRSLRASQEVSALRQGRTCYDHLAGILGVAVFDAMVKEEWIVSTCDGSGLGPGGEEGFASIGVDISSLQAKRRTLVRPCLDWTERRPHLAGSLGAAVAESLLARRWVEPLAQHRAVRLTDCGQSELASILNVRLGW